MKTILKIIWKNISEKKIRSILIIFTLVLTTVLTFISIGTKNTTEKIVLEMSKKYVGNADIVIKLDKTNKINSFSIKEEKKSPSYNYVIGAVDLKGSITVKDKEKISLVLRGIKLEDLQKNTGLNVQGLDEENFSGNKIIISKKFSEDYNLQVGEDLKVTSNNQNETFKVVAICDSKGIFLADGETSFAVVPIEYLQNRLNLGKKVNKTFIQLKNQDEKAKCISQLKEKYKNYDVKEAIIQSEIDTAINNQTSPYKIITVIVLLLSIVIITYIFKIISLERIPTIGTLRSLGGTKKMSLIVLMLESLFYSVIASAIGCALGIVMMNLVLKNTVPENLKNLNIGVDFSLMQFLVSIAVTLLVSIIGSIVPSIKISKISVKDVLFGTIENKNAKVGVLKLLIVLIMIGIPIFTPRSLVSDFAIVFEILALALLITGIILLTPYVVNFISNFVSKSFMDVGSNSIYIAIKNFKDNKNILANIIILTVSLSTFLLVYSITNSVIQNTDDLYRDNAKYDLFVWYEATNENGDLERQCYSNNNVNDLYTTLFSYDHAIDKTDYKIEKLQGADTNKYFNYWQVNFADGSDIEEIKKTLDSNRNIIITSVMKDRLGIEKGDNIPLYFGKVIINYKVIGFMDSINTNGNNAIISEKYFEKDVKDTYYKDICINITGDENEIKKELLGSLYKNNVTVKTINEMEKDNYEEYRGIYTMLEVLSGIVLLVGMIGIVNNQVINFIQRKKHFSIQRSIGMSKKQLSNMLLIEAIVSGVIGGVMALVGGNLLIYIIPNFLKANGQVLTINYSLETSVLTIAVGIILTIICSIMTVWRSSKLSIIESIRYE